MRIFLITLFLLVTAAPVRASDGFFEWQSTNGQLLHGKQFESGPETQTIFTFEHSHGWTYGDNYITFDAVFGHPDLINAEFSPRLSLGKMTGLDLSYGWLSDVLISTTWEKARRYDAYLYGGAVDFNLPGFALFQLNAYIRQNPDVEGTGWQITPVWSRPFNLGGIPCTFDGYIDYAGGEHGTTNLHTQPQLLLDAGKAWGIADEGHAYVGTELRYWHNAYGVEGLDEVVPQVMIKWVL